MYFYQASGLKNTIIDLSKVHLIDIGNKYTLKAAVSDIELNNLILSVAQISVITHW